MGKVIALDYGEKRIGVAISDEMKIIATPLTVLMFKDWKVKLKSLLKDEEIEKIIIGLPRNMDGSLGSLFEKVNKFKSEIEKVVVGSVPVEFEDETLSSIEAEKRVKKRGIDVRKNKGEVDKEAATIILESYLGR